MIPLEEKPWMKYYTDENFKEYDLNKSIYDFIKDMNEGYPDNEPTINLYGDIVDRAEFLRRCREFGKAFYELGVNSSNYTIAMIMPTMEETYEVMYGASYVGCRINPIDFRNFNPEVLKASINAAGAKLLVICDLICNKELINYLFQNTELEHMVVIHMPATGKTQVGREITDFMLKAKASSIVYDGEKVLSLEQFYEKAAQSEFTEEMRFKKPGDKFLLVQSSGTTGSMPKRLYASECQLNKVIKQHMNCHVKFERGDRVLDIMPKWAFFGFVGMHWGLSIGMIICPVVIPMAIFFLDMIKRYKPQFTMCSPTFALALLNSNVKDLNCFKTFIVGGDSVPYELEGRLNAMFQKYGKIKHISSGYSASENCAVGCACQNDIYKQGSVGIPYPEMEFMVIDEKAFYERNELVRLPIGQEGIFCMGGLLVEGYDESHKEDEERLFRYDERGDRWFVAEDIGYIDEDGFLFFKNREKDIIITKDGTKVIPKVVEDTIRKNENVANCVAVGKAYKGDKPGEFICCYIVPRDGKPGFFKKRKMIKDSKKLAKTFLPFHSRPAKYVFLDALPMTPMGKLDRKKLKGM